MKKEPNITQKLLETVERYLNDTMELSEKMEFEKSLKEDSYLQQQVNDIKILLSGIENASFKSKLEEFHSQLDTGKKPSNVKRLHKKANSNRFLFYSIAASIVALFGIFWLIKTPANSEKIFATYFTTDPGLPTTMGNKQEFKFYDGMVNYKRKEYQKALQKWELILPVKKNNDTLNYFIGVTYLTEGNSEKAIPFLEKVQKHSNSMFLEDSYFYLGLSYLKNNNKNLAIENLKKSNHPDAEKIIEQLKK